MDLSLVDSDRSWSSLRHGVGNPKSTKTLVAYQTAIGDAIAAIGPYSAIGSRALELRYPP